MSLAIRVLKLHKGTYGHHILLVEILLCSECDVGVLALPVRGLGVLSVVRLYVD